MSEFIYTNKPKTETPKKKTKEEEEKEDLVTSLSGFREHVGMDFVWGSRGVSFERHGLESELLVLLFLKVKAL